MQSSTYFRIMYFRLFYMLWYLVVVCCERIPMKLFQSLLLSFGLFASCGVLGETLHVAVASNFIGPMKALIKEFESQTNHKVKASYGSSGKIYAQILHGAPYDLFFSADQDKPKKLEEKGLAVKGSRFTYAQGKLLVCTKRETSLTGEVLKDQLEAGRFSKLAMANPKLAPYGKASLEVLNKLGLEDEAKTKLIMGENIAQAFQFVTTKNAELGFIAASQVVTKTDQDIYCWDIPQTHYQSINQDVIQLKRSQSKPAVCLFMKFMSSMQSKDKIRSFGYVL